VARALFFGRLRDAAGCAEREIAFDRAVDFAAFRRMAAAGDHNLEEALGAPSVRVAINAVLALRPGASAIAPSDEVAFMPPFSGG
jgi:molybdopterin synthase sulfur carrier subunit